MYLSTSTLSELIQNSCLLMPPRKQSPQLGLKQFEGFSCLGYSRFNILSLFYVISTVCDWCNMYRQFISAPSSGFPSQVSLMVQFHTKTTHDPSSGSSTALIKLEPKKLKIFTNKGIHFDETSSEASNTSRRSSLTKSTYKTSSL